MANFRKHADNELNSLHEKVNVQAAKIQELEAKLLEQESYSRKPNLIVEGIPYTEGENLYEKMKVFFAETLHLKETIHISICHRLGRPRGDRPAPAIVKFVYIRQRELVWASKKEIKKGTKTFIREDLPGKVMEARRKLLPALRAAKASKQAKRVQFKGDKLMIDGNAYGESDLDTLPYGIDPTQNHTRNVGDYTLFFTKDSILSNFHEASFKVNGDVYSSVEQFYQVKRAEFYKDDHVASKMRIEKSPRKIKALSYTVKTPEGERRWFEKEARATMLTGVRAKFEQNADAREFLVSKTNKYIAEANPKDNFFSIGLSLYHPDCGNESKWEGKNILGDILVQVKHELK